MPINSSVFRLRKQSVIKENHRLWHANISVKTNIVLVIDFNDVYFGIFYCNLCHSTTDCRNFSRKDTNNSWNYIRWMNYLRPAGDGCRHDRPNRRRQPAELSLRRGEGRARNLGFPSLELFNDYSSNSTEIQTRKFESYILWA